ncbi:MAG: helix-turn-helix domain-containing protein [Ignavibacteria bacterium]|nr:helix-turn-helix domain-containing protein [Ignavibacteria bacterium]
MNVTRFGAYLKHIRTERKLTLADVEQLSRSKNTSPKILQKYISDLENGQTAKPDLNKLKVLGELYDIKQIFTLYYTLAGIDDDDLPLTQFILEYLKIPIDIPCSAKFTESKKDIIQYLTVLYKIANSDLTCKKVNVIEHTLHNYMRRELDESQRFMLQASKHLENLKLLHTSSCLIKDEDIELFKNLKDWFRNLRLRKIRGVRFIITNKEALPKVYPLIKEYWHKYFSYNSVMVYLIDEADIKNEYSKKTFAKIVTLNNKYIYHVERDRPKDNKERFELLHTDIEKMKRTDDAIAHLLSCAADRMIVSEDLKDIETVKAIYFGGSKNARINGYNTGKKFTDEESEVKFELETAKQ